MQETLINIGLLALSMFFILTGVLKFMRGMQSRSRRFAYDVGRMAARGSAFWSWLQGFVFLSIGVALFAFWAFYNPAAAQLEPEITPTVEPTETVVKPTIPLERDDAGENEAAVEAEPAVVEAQPQPTNVPVQAQPTNTPLPPQPTVPLTPTLPTATPLPTPTPGPATDGTVDIIGGLYLRNNPNGEVVVLLENGSGVFFLGGEQEDGAYTWIEIEAVTGEVGWVAKDFVKTNQ